MSYPAGISFKTDREIKSFSDKQKLRRLSTTNPALQQILKGCTWSKNTKEGKRSTKSIPIKKMVIGSEISIITLSVNGVNSPTTRQRLAERIKNKTHIYPVYKKSTSDLKTHMD